MKIENQEITCETTYEIIDVIKDNGKTASVSRWRSFDSNCGETDCEIEVIDGDLSDGELDEIREIEWL